MKMTRRQIMWRLLIVLIVLVATLIWSRPSAAEQAPCADGKVCVSEEKRCLENEICLDRDMADRFWNAGATVRCLEQQLANDRLKVTANTYRIVVDDEGRVFSKDKMIVHLKWCGYDLDLEYEPELDVHRRPDTEPDFGIRFRFRIGVVFRFVPHADQSFSDPRTLTGPVVSIESFYWRFLHAETHLGLDTFGVGVGVDITRNLDIYTGIGSRWVRPKQVTPVLGLTLSVN